MKSLLKKVIAMEIQHHQRYVTELKDACNYFYSKAEKGDEFGEVAFKHLNEIRNKIRKEKRILRNLGNVQKAIKDIPDAYFESYSKKPLEDSTLQAWIIGKDGELFNDLIETSFQELAALEDKIADLPAWGG